MEVLSGVDLWVIEFFVLRTGPASPIARARHVVNHCIGDDFYTHPVTARNHVLELLSGTEPGFDAIADRLVVDPPLPLVYVFLGRRD
jgi:hypothetical protein